MKNNTVKETNLQELKREIVKYKRLVKDLQSMKNSYETYMEICKTKILDLMDFLEIDNLDNVRKTKRRMLPAMTVKQLRNLFNDKDISDLVVARIDVDASIDHFKLMHGYSDAMIKNTFDIVLSNFELEYDELEVTK